MKLDEGHLIIILITILCILAVLDIWRQYAVRSDSFWITHYNSAVKSSYQFWGIGYRLEDLEIKLEKQQKHLNHYLHYIDTTLAPKFILSGTTLRRNTHHVEYVRESRISLYNMQHNDTQVYKIRCEQDGPTLRFGLNDFRTDFRDECQIFTNVKSHMKLGPQSYFHVIPIAEGAFALRSVASSLFIKVVPPPYDSSSGSSSNAPWKLMIGGPVVGTAETFRLTDEGYLYSPLLNGFFTCDAGQPVLGYPSKYGHWNHFLLESISEKQAKEAYLDADLSRQLLQIQRHYLEDQEDRLRSARKSTATSVATPAPTSAVKICIAVPVTSKGTEMKEVSASPFWNNLFDSFMKSIDWRSNKLIFAFYIGFDRGDSLYDTGDAWSEFRDEFRHRAIYRMTEQMMDETAINAVLSTLLSVKLMHFEDLAGAPSQVVSQLVLKAYDEGFDYFYQVNDDTVLDTPNWAPKLMQTLRTNPVHANLGVTGPKDANNEKIFTHAFVHRTHIEIFGHLFPPSFKNWWSDDWISTVYGRLHTFRSIDVIIQHNVKGQKVGDLNRYQVDKSAQFELDFELRVGHAQIDRWLKSKELPRLPLPEICSYLPAVRYISDSVIDKNVKLLPEQQET